MNSIETNELSPVDFVLKHGIQVQEILKKVMKEGFHYGIVSGTKNKVLFKPGAELLCMAFHISDEYKIEDLSTSEYAQFRITCTGINQKTGLILGSGVGLASSNEEKYKWRKAVCIEEYEDSPENKRRIKYILDYKTRKPSQIRQVRIDFADVANTVIKMGCKRAKIAMTINVLAVSDMFTQDLEDMEETLRISLTEKEKITKKNEELPANTELGIRLVQSINDTTSIEHLQEVWSCVLAEARQAKDNIAFSYISSAKNMRKELLKNSIREEVLETVDD